ncbi:hypothetical protein B0J14DRAFT_687050 [Halenospora varia]|nr:hypothetical protein B0J14DRAFT_687050 [Halenospora varia]
MARVRHVDSIRGQHLTLVESDSSIVGAGNSCRRFHQTLVGLESLRSSGPGPDSNGRVCDSPDCGAAVTPISEFLESPRACPSTSRLCPPRLTSAMWKCAPTNRGRNQASNSQYDDDATFVWSGFGSLAPQACDRSVVSSELVVIIAAFHLHFHVLSRKALLQHAMPTDSANSSDVVAPRSTRDTQVQLSAGSPTNILIRRSQPEDAL